MKKILIISGPVYPFSSTNSNLMQRIAEHITDEIVWLSVGPYEIEGQQANLGKNIHVIKYSTVQKTIIEAPEGFPRKDFSCRWRGFYWLKGRIIDRNGYGDGETCLRLTELVDRLQKRYSFDLIFACLEPFSAGFAIGNCHTDTKKALYLIDPLADIVPGMESCTTAFRRRSFLKIISCVDLVITTDRIFAALKNAGMEKLIKKPLISEFPLLSVQGTGDRCSIIPFPSERINLLYCGWLRNEEFFASVIEGLDNRYCVTFIGNETKRVKAINSGALIRQFDLVERETAVNAIQHADILICIGNPYPVHIPSKIFDYISSGKPIVLFYSIPACPAMQYLRRYPMALCISDQEEINVARKKLESFCIEYRGKELEKSEIERRYSDIDSEQIIQNIVKSISAE